MSHPVIILGGRDNEFTYLAQILLPRSLRDEWVGYYPIYLLNQPADIKVE